MKKTSYLLVILLLFAVFSVAYAAGTLLHNVKGYSWSLEKNSPMGYPEGVGWINANPANANFGGVYMNDAGTLSGYAWANPRFVPPLAISNSNNIGWLSFNQTSGCPTGGNCAPKVTSTTTVSTVIGWARFLANDQSYTGWVHLSGIAGDGSPYGVTYDPSSHTLSGWAWGDKVIGWIHVNFTVDGTCEAPISPGIPTGLHANTSSQCGGVIELGWNAPFPPPSASPYGGYYVYRDGIFAGQSATPFYVDNVTPNSSHIYRVSAYNLSACGIAESDQSNMATGKASAACDNSVPALSLKCVPANVTKGQPATLNWTVSTAGSCTITSTDSKFPYTFDVTAGSKGSVATSPVNQTRDYTLTCINGGGKEAITATTKGTCYVSAEYQHF